MIRTAPWASFLTTALLLGGPLLLGGCDAVEGQDDFERDALQAPAGFARTDATGTLLSDDPDDWRTAPLYAFDFLVTPRPYPNPARPDEGVTIQMQVSDVIPGGLRLRAYRGLERLPWQGLQVAVPGASFYTFTFFPGEITGAVPGELVRLIVFDGQGNTVTYGDLQIAG
jgi:hypothetical protein